MNFSAKPEMRSLATLLARLDAVFWPFMGNDETRCIGACMELRDGWLHGKGLPMREHSPTASGRKDVEQLWRRLADAGLVSVAADGGRRTHVKFTPTGETLTRCLCATGCTYVYWPVFLRLARLIDSTGEVSLPESFTCGAEPYTGDGEQAARIRQQRFRLLPFITVGWLSFWHDCRGCQWLGLTDAGRAAIAAGRPARPGEEWTLDEGVAAIYDRALDREEIRLASTRPSNETNLFPPCSASIGWGHFRNTMDRRRREREEATA